jgi:transcription elongation factor Elf1
MHALPYQIDCPECGCVDVDVQRRPDPDQWFGTGQAACNECGYPFAFKEPGLSQQEEDQTDYPGVPYTPARCPRCQSGDAPVQHTSGRTRYHRCRKCGLNFKSVEK